MQSSSIDLSDFQTPIRKSDVSEQEFESLLEKYAKKFQITAPQLQKLKKIKKNGERAISSSNLSFVYEVFGMIKQIGFEDTYNYLESLSGTVPLDSKFVLESSLFEAQHKSYQVEIARMRDEFQVKVKGLYKCRKCKSENVIDTRAANQRRGDEADLYTVRCMDCNYTWTV